MSVDNPDNMLPRVMAVVVDAPHPFDGASPGRDLNPRRILTERKSAVLLYNHDLQTNPDRAFSNIGSFGEQVFKIGMTRRLEPMDRVRELGAASVPFPFDIHAMVYSEDAPALEAAFHQRFKDRSVNLVNLRKEFFRVDLAELEAFAKQRGLAMAFTRLAEAREYRESAAMRLARGSGPTTMPASLEDRAAMTSALAKFSSKPRREEHAGETTGPLRQVKPS